MEKANAKVHPPYSLTLVLVKREKEKERGKERKKERERVGKTYFMPPPYLVALN